MVQKEANLGERKGRLGGGGNHAPPPLEEMNKKERRSPCVEEGICHLLIGKEGGNLMMVHGLSSSLSLKEFGIWRPFPVRRRGGAK